MLMLSTGTTARYARVARSFVAMVGDGLLVAGFKSARSDGPYSSSPFRRDTWKRVPNVPATPLLTKYVRSGFDVDHVYVDRANFNPNETFGRTHIAESIDIRSASCGSLKRPVHGAAAKVRSMFSKSQRHRWQPEKRFVISTMTDKIINRSGRVNAIDHAVPENQRFEMGAKTPGRFGTSIFASATALSGMDKTCRLDLHGHGNEHAFAKETASSLATKLFDAGLKEVGVIKFHSCSVGKGSFPEELVQELGKKGIGVGYISSALSSMVDLRHAGKIKGKEFVYNPVFYVPAKLIGARLETYGLKVTKGNIEVQFPGTRYQSGQ